MYSNMIYYNICCHIISYYCTLYSRTFFPGAGGASRTITIAFVITTVIMCIRHYMVGCYHPHSYLLILLTCCIYI